MVLIVAQLEDTELSSFRQLAYPGAGQGSDLLHRPGLVQGGISGLGGLAAWGVFGVSGFQGFRFRISIGLDGLDFCKGLW